MPSRFKCRPSRSTRRPRALSVRYTPPGRTWMNRVGRDRWQISYAMPWAEPTSSLRARLVEAGAEIPGPPADEDAVSSTLQALIGLLAASNVFLSCTEHLTDGQLLEHLFRALDEPDCPPSNPFYQASTETLLEAVPEEVRATSDVEELLEELRPATLTPTYPVMLLDMLGEPHHFDMRSWLACYATPHEREHHPGPCPKRVRKPARGRDATLPDPEDYVAPVVLDA